MDSTELVLSFPSATEVKVAFGGTDSGNQAFSNPLSDQDRKDIRWYVETYGAASLADPDDQEAKRIERRLPEIGKALFDAVFSQRGTQRLFDRFQGADTQQRTLTIDSEDAAILSLPWELLHDSGGNAGVFLFRERPHISIRRRISGATDGRVPYQVTAKDRLHLLFIVSRPTGVGFIDPRADAAAVLDALEEHAPGRVSCEFLRPATLNALEARLRARNQPDIDILHFDGHGVFTQVSEQDAEQDPGLYGRSVLSEIQRQRRSRGPAGTAQPTREHPTREHPTSNQPTADQPVGVGFLLFEKPDGGKQLIPTEDLRNTLYQAKVGLVVLSACQSADLDSRGNPMASVAGRLTSTGIPAILAMTHSVLVATTRALFGQFYQGLARGHGIADALDDARIWLDDNPGKYEVQRGNQRRLLELDDWFLPALYHAGADTPLLTPQPADTAATTATPATPRHKLRDNLRKPHEAGFFGRRRELWDIDRWFADPDKNTATRRLSITGFGGQGKTELALEAGRWLLRSGLFQAVVWVDYARVQSLDARAVAVSTIATVLEQTLIDADAATRALAATPTLVILDNLETLPADSLSELLDAAVAWSKAGGSRLLLTSRVPDFQHPDYRIEGTRIHRRIKLDGLGSAAQPDDALDWFGELSKLPMADEGQAVPPPTRDDLIALFDRVRFHPLSIAVLARQLRTCSAKQLGERLEQLLGEDAVSAIGNAGDPGTPRSLIASLLLSLERLNDAQRDQVRRLGVFQGGAFEDDLLAITGLGQAGDGNERETLRTLLSALEGGDPRAFLRAMGIDLPDGAELPAELAAGLNDNPEIAQKMQQIRAQLADLPDDPAAAAENLWPALRRELEAAALIEAERVPGVGPPFLRFHPTLAAMLWAGLDAGQRAELSQAHRKRYHALANYLYQQDDKNPHQARAIAMRELPNLSHAVDQALDAGDPDAVLFVEAVNRFLKVFGMTREAGALTRRAGQAAGETGSEAWFLARSGHGEQLRASGQAGEASQVFREVLEALGDQPSYKLVLTLVHLGRCYRDAGRSDLAEAEHRRGIKVCGHLEQTDEVKRDRGLLHTELANVLRDQGRFGEAREHYETSLAIMQKLDDLRSEAAIMGQLGILAMLEGDLPEAVKRFQEALELFQRLEEPAMQAVAHHQLGLVFQQARQWDQAEQHYRESASLNEQQGDLSGAAQTWNSLAIISMQAGKPEAAEDWYRKAISAGKKTGDRALLSMALNNLAALLQGQPDRLTEAHDLAMQALAIKETLDPAATEIWTTYSILAEIADRQGQAGPAAAYRRQARDAKRNYAGTAHEMKQIAPIIAMVVGAVAGEEQARSALGPLLQQLTEASGENAKFATTIDRILAGERDADTLCAPIGGTAAMIVETLLQAIEDPSTLEALLPKDEPPA